MIGNDYVDLADEFTITPADARSVVFRLGQIETQLRNTQALVARTYERTFSWNEVLANARDHENFDGAYDDEPLVTVRIATFNQAELLCNRALASLLRQTYKNWEAIVVGDNCTDDTAARIAAIGDPRIRFINLDVRGPYPTEAKARWYVAGIGPMNTALAQAKGSWIAPLDHDDEWDDDHLAVLLDAARVSRAEVVYGRLAVVDGTTHQPIVEMGSYPPIRGEFGFLSAIHHVGLAAFRYDLNCRFADEPGDWNVARRMWDAGVKFHFIDRTVATVFFTQRHETASTTEARMIEELRHWSQELLQARDHWKSVAELAWVDNARLQDQQARALLSPPEPRLSERIRPISSLPLRLARKLARRIPAAE